MTNVIERMPLLLTHDASPASGAVVELSRKALDNLRAIELRLRGIINREPTRSEVVEFCLWSIRSDMDQE